MAAIINALPSTQAYKAAVAAARTSATRSWEEARTRGAQIEALRMKAMRDRNTLYPLKRNPFGPDGSLSVRGAVTPKNWIKVTYNNIVRLFRPGRLK